MAFRKRKAAVWTFRQHRKCQGKSMEERIPSKPGIVLFPNTDPAMKAHREKSGNIRGFDSRLDALSQSAKVVSQIRASEGRSACARHGARDLENSRFANASTTKREGSRSCPITWRTPNRFKKLATSQFTEGALRRYGVRLPPAGLRNCRSQAYGMLAKSAVPSSQ